jgi:hypothetical protein
MIHETITKIEAQLQEAGSLDETRRRELMGLLATLKHEVTELSKIDADQAQSIATFVASSTHEATREQKKPEQLTHALGGLSASVEGFEESHPNLVHIVNRICTTLSNIGI